MFATLHLLYSAGMQPHVEAIVKSLVAVAWADGRFDGEESDVLEALVAAFELGPQDAAAIREYAMVKRSLDDVPLTDLSAEDRKLLLQHAVVLTYVDGEQSDAELALLNDLVTRLHVPQDEAAEILVAADRRARRLLSLL